MFQDITYRVVCPICGCEFERSLYIEDAFYTCPDCGLMWNVFDTGRRITLRGSFPDGRTVRWVTKDFEELGG